MNNMMVTLIKKELFHFFQEKRLVFSTLIMPGLLIFIMYQLMGTAINQKYINTTTYYKVQYSGEEQCFRKLFPEEVFIGTQISSGHIDSGKKKVQKEKLDLVIIIPQGFEDAAKSYDVNSSEKAPKVEIYYNSANTNSLAAFRRSTDILNIYENKLNNKFDINPGSGKFDLSSSKDQSGKFLGMMLPFLILVFLYSGCVNIAPDSIAGEKERGILASVLVTPAKRSFIAISKIVSLSIICVFSALSSAIGTLLSLPKIAMGTVGMNAGIAYSPLDYILFVAVVLSTALLLVGMICVLSVLAKTVKEAQSYMLPLLLLVMLIGVSGMLQNGKIFSIKYAFIPLYNSVQSMVSIFTFHTSLTFCLVSIIVNIIATGICSLILAKIYSSEYVV